MVEPKDQEEAMAEMLKIYKENCEKMRQMERKMEEKEEEEKREGDNKEDEKKEDQEEQDN